VPIFACSPPCCSGTPRAASTHATPAGSECGGSDTALTTSSIEVDFSEPVAHATAQAAFAISPSVEGSYSWSSASLTFTPATRLPLRTRFEVSIGPGVRDLAGNASTTSAPPFRFTTVGNPSVVASDPAASATKVALDSPIVVDFSTLMDTASVERALSVDPAVEVQLRWARERLTIVPNLPLDPNRRYTLTIGVAALDQAGTPLDAPFTLTFSTVPSSLRADTLVPADRVAGTSVDSPIAIVFDRALDPASVRDDLLSIEPAVAGSLEAIAAPGAAGLADPERRILRFQPSGPLDPDTTYRVTLKPGLFAADGAGLPSELSWSFTTGAPAATLSNQIVFLSDRAGIANLWAMNPDGSNQRQLSAELSPVTGYAVAPDGRAFVVSDGAVVVWQKADGSARRLLTEAGSIEFDPAYSPDGGTLVFGRADPALGSGLGLWMRDGDGSHPRPVELPTEQSAAPSPTPSGKAPIPLLRAPRIAPDGTALAFVDDAGSVSILDLGTGAITTALFFAESEPIWLPDSSGVLVTGRSPGSGAARAYGPHSAVPLLDPASFNPDATQVAALRIVLLDSGFPTLLSTGLGGGAARPSVDAGARIVYLKLEAAGAEAGSTWVTDSPDSPGARVTGDAGALTGSVSFAPKPGAIVTSRVNGPTDAVPGAGGVWSVSLVDGSARQLSTDGWLPRWLP